MKNITPDCVYSSVRHHGLFKGVSNTTLKHINKTKKVLSMKKGTIVFQEGNPASGFLGMHRGIVKEHQIENSGKEQTCNVEHPENKTDSRYF